MSYLQFTGELAGAFELGCVLLDCSGVVSLFWSLRGASPPVDVSCCTFESVALLCSWEASLSHCLLLCLISSSASLSSRWKPCHERSPNGLQNGSEKNFKSEASWVFVLMCSFNTAPPEVWARTSWSSSLEESVMRSPSVSLYCNWRSLPSPRLGKRPVSLSFSWSNVKSDVTRNLRVSESSVTFRNTIMTQYRLDTSRTNWLTETPSRTFRSTYMRLYRPATCSRWVGALEASESLLWCLR